MPHRPEKMEGMERLVRHNGESRERICRPEATIDDSLEGKAPAARRGPKGLRRTTGS
jgi:hypothetical protein